MGSADVMVVDEVYVVLLCVGIRLSVYVSLTKMSVLLLDILRLDIV